MSFDSDLNACAALVEKGDPDRFAACMASPVPARRVLFPLYAFNMEVARAPWVTQETMIAEMRLQWWRDALEEIGAGTPVRRHDVVTPLSRILDPSEVQILDRLVAARRWDIYREPFEDQAHFERYLDETSAGLMWVAARALARAAGLSPDADAEAPVRALGRATGLARFLRAVPELEARNRIPLVDGRPASVAAMAQEAAAQAATGREARKRLPRAARPALTESFLARAILMQAAAAPERVAGGGLGVNPLWRSWLLWRWS